MSLPLASLAAAHYVGAGALDAAEALLQSGAGRRLVRN